MGLAVVLLLQSQSANPSPIPGLLLILAVARAIVDWRYIRKGGKPSSRRDKILFWSVTGVIVLFLTVLRFMGANAEGIGAASVQIATTLCSLGVGPLENASKVSIVYRTEAGATA